MKNKTISHSKIDNTICQENILEKIEKEGYFYQKFSQLGAEIAHEIGNPLSGMITTLEVLNDGIHEFSHQETAEYLGRITEEIRRLFDFLKSIRSLTDETSMRIKSRKLKSFIDESITQYQGPLRENRIAVKNRVDPQIEVFVDDYSFRQVMSELIVNSIDHMSTSGRIEISGKPFGESFVEMTYRNNGKPIPIAHLERIFLPLYSTKSKSKGLGLARAQKAMTRMGGFIMAAAPDKGTGVKFLLYFPHLSQKK